MSTAADYAYSMPTRYGLADAATAVPEADAPPCAPTITGAEPGYARDPMNKLASRSLAPTIQNMLNIRMGGEQMLVHSGDNRNIARPLAQHRRPGSDTIPGIDLTPPCA